jgi:FlaA1/EpsC-like NDP-sugar epimerase
MSERPSPTGGHSSSDVRHLLGRRETPLSRPAGSFRGQRILVTGAAGSIGGLVVRALIADGAAEVRALDRSEEALLNLQADPGLDRPAFRPLLDDAGDATSMTEHLRDCDLVIHAAAYKQVPMAERFPRRVAIDNLRSARALFGAWCEHPQTRLVQISTDKVHGGGIMGLTKRAAEGMLNGLAATASREESAGFAIARLANVLGSTSSVFHIFAQHLATGRPLPLTGANATRLFLGEEETVALILRAALGAEATAVYAADPGNPLRMLDFARRFGALFGVPDPEIAILPPRPGDRDHEHLFDDDEAAKAVYEGSLIRLERSGVAPISLAAIDAGLAELAGARNEDVPEILTRLIEAI